MMSKIEWPVWESLEWDRSTATIHNLERVMIRVVARPVNGCSVGGRHAPPGESYQLVYRKDLPTILKMVPSEAQVRRYAMALEDFQAKFEAHVKACRGDREEAEKTRGFSIESVYHAGGEQPLTKTGYPPLVSVDVGPSVPPPETPASLAAKSAKETAAAFAEALVAHTAATTAATKHERAAKPAA